MKDPKHYRDEVLTTFDTWCLESGLDLDFPTQAETDELFEQGASPLDAAMDLIDRYASKVL